jgi:hypothetical protein
MIAKKCEETEMQKGYEGKREKGWDIKVRKRQRKHRKREIQ